MKDTESWQMMLKIKQVTQNQEDKLINHSGTLFNVSSVCLRSYFNVHFCSERGKIKTGTPGTGVCFNHK